MRTRQPFYLNKAGMLATLIAAAFTPYAFALTPAGKIDFAFGTATATGADGVIRPLKKGTEVYSGDAITTTDGRIQIRFSDGAYLALQPNTLFKVDQYAYEGKSDGKEKASYALVKGGLRTITGAIGKVNKQNYEIRTPTATIGIRGTSLGAESDENGTTVSVYNGLVSVSSQGGSVTLSRGQSAHVSTPQSSPQMTDQQAAADQIVAERKQQEELEQQTQTERPLDTQPLFTAGDQRVPGPSGASIPTTQIIEQTNNTTNPVSGPGYSIVEAWGLNNGFSGTNLYSSTNTQADFIGTALSSFFEGSDGEGITSSYNGTLAEAHWDGLIGWGRWVDEGMGSGGGEGEFMPLALTSGTHQHYVVGKATSDTAITALNGTTVNFALLGATSAVSYRTSGSAEASLGTFTGSAAVHFNSAEVNTRMDITANITDSLHGNYSGTFNNLYLNPNGGSGSSVATFSASSPSGSSERIHLNGLFTGPNADRLGIAYRIDQSDIFISRTGAAVFTATSTPPP